MSKQQKFKKITAYPITAQEYKEREKAYSKNWQIKFFFIAILAVMSYFLPEVVVSYYLKISVNKIILQVIGVVLVFGVIFISRNIRKTLAREYGLFCPKCEEIFDYWSDKKNAVSYGGICPNCKFKITDAAETKEDIKEQA